MNAPVKRKRVHARIHNRNAKCSGQHQFPEPLHTQRPLVVFCTQCQTGKDVA